MKPNSRIFGAIQAHVDGPTEFGIQSRYRLKAREAFIKWDIGERMQRAILRKAAPVAGEYKQGDVVSLARDANQKEGERGRQWSVGSRIVGFEGDNVWLNCMGIPILASI